MLERVKTIGNRLAKPDILFWIIPLMMALLVLGTVAQKQIGLYAAQQKFFGSFFAFIGPIPLPAGLTLMGLFLVNLLCKFIFRSDWSWQKSGTILAHFGVLLLVLGGLVTTLSASEGFLAVRQGKSNNIVEDYHQRRLVIRAGDETVFVLPHTDIKDGLEITAAGVPFTLAIDKYCFNCRISLRPEPDKDGWHGASQSMMLNKTEADPQDEKNMAGIEFTVKGVTADKDGKYLTFDGFPKPPVIEVNGTGYKISLERTERPLPFSVRLDKFTRKLHTGTDMAKSYISEITIEDNERNLSFPAVIEMNEPLRYRGYTLYQSSFDISGDAPYTILAIVENKGRIFPYIASIIIAFGLMVHLAMRLARSKKAKGDAQ